jgi:hypothetical protein
VQRRISRFLLIMVLMLALTAVGGFSLVMRNHCYFFFGTFLPALRACDRPIAIACFLLFTFLPLPLFKVPFFRSCIVFLTLRDAALEYLRAMMLLRLAVSYGNGPARECTGPACFSPKRGVVSAMMMTTMTMMSTATEVQADARPVIARTVAVVAVVVVIARHSAPAVAASMFPPATAIRDLLSGGRASALHTVEARHRGG